MPRSIPVVKAPVLGRHSDQLERDDFYTSRAWRKLRAAFLAAKTRSVWTAFQSID